ncbi:MAG: AAA family ATPase, partial [Phycisphaerales bacterium]|nr:AAA family ATPase [Phycisphaerales bacterium]
RRFQVVQIDEPSEARCVRMLRGMASTLEKHHQVQLLDEGIEAAVRLSHRYIPARQLPDKAVSLIDTACARVAVGQHAVPAEIDDCRKHIDALDTELEIIDREAAIGLDHGARRADIEAKRAAEGERLAGLEANWEKERDLVNEILAIRRTLRGELGEAVDHAGAAAPTAAAAESSEASEAGASTATEAPPAIDREAELARLRTLQTELEALQGESPLILPSVDAQAIASVVADWTGIPVGRMVKNEIDAVLKLGATLGKRVIGQQHGLDMIARRIQTSRASLDNPSKPIGVFMLAGPSGVGKTETALALAEALYGGEHNVITINMSEFQEAHTVSTLKGAPPGYVGYGEGGILTEAVRRKPYSIVLLDEVEKAHPDVHEIFFQVFDKGVMEDGEGRLINFKNTIILLTTNVGSDLIMNLCKDPDLMPDAEGIAQALREPLLKTFPAALLGRIVTIPYYPLSDDMLKAIIRLQLGRIVKRMAESHKVPLEFDDGVIDLIASRCTELESGGRMVDAILTNTMLPAISKHFLEQMLDGQVIERVKVTTEDNDFRYTFA